MFLCFMKIFLTSTFENQSMFKNEVTSDNYIFFYNEEMPCVIYNDIGSYSRANLLLNQILSQNIKFYDMFILKPIEYKVLSHIENNIQTHIYEKVDCKIFSHNNNTLSLIHVEMMYKFIKHIITYYKVVPLINTNMIFKNINGFIKFLITDTISIKIENKCKIKEYLTYVQNFFLLNRNILEFKYKYDNMNFYKTIIFNKNEIENIINKLLYPSNDIELIEQKEIRLYECVKQTNFCASRVDYFFPETKKEILNDYKITEELISSVKNDSYILSITNGSWLLFSIKDNKYIIFQIGHFDFVLKKYNLQIERQLKFYYNY